MNDEFKEFIKWLENLIFEMLGHVLAYSIIIAIMLGIGCLIKKMFIYLGMM